MSNENSFLSRLIQAAAPTDKPSPAVQALQELARQNQRAAALRDLENGKHVKTCTGSIHADERRKK